MKGVIVRSRSPVPRVHLHLEVLEDRTVPAVLDLTTVGASESINNVSFIQANPQPTGVGVINDFLRIQAKKGSMEQGFNSNKRPVKFDEKKDHHTRAIHLSELPTATIGGVVHRIILLGINQNQSQPLLSLDELRLYVGDSPTLSNYNATTKLLGGLTAVFDMGDNWVKLNSSLSHGNGSGDMYLVVPESLLVSATGNPDPYIYLYSKFGLNHGANGGFEQWAPGVGFVAPPSEESSLSGFVYRDANGDGVFDTTVGDQPIVGVLVTLTGTNAQGSVEITIATEQDGSYHFNNLLPGTYFISEAQPLEFSQGINSVGTINGVTNGEELSVDLLGNILLGAGQNGIHYNFGEVQGGEG